MVTRTRFTDRFKRLWALLTMSSLHAVNILYIYFRVPLWLKNEPPYPFSNDERATAAKKLSAAAIGSAALKPGAYSSNLAFIVCKRDKSSFDTTISQQAIVQVGCPRLNRTSGITLITLSGVDEAGANGEEQKPFIVICCVEFCKHGSQGRFAYGVRSCVRKIDTIYQIWHEINVYSHFRIQALVSNAGCRSRLHNRQTYQYRPYHSILPQSSSSFPLGAVEGKHKRF